MVQGERAAIAERSYLLWSRRFQECARERGRGGRGRGEEGGRVRGEGRRGEGGEAGKGGKGGEGGEGRGRKEGGEGGRGEGGRRGRGVWSVVPSQGWQAQNLTAHFVLGFDNCFDWVVRHQHKQILLTYLPDNPSIKHLYLAVTEASAKNYRTFLPYLLHHVARLPDPVRTNILTFGLHQAAPRGHTDAVALLLVSGATDGIIPPARETALDLAAMKGHGAVVKLLTDYCANISTIQMLIDADADAEEACGLAIVYNFPNLVSLFLEGGVNVHEENDMMLWIAAKRNHVEIMKLLLDAGADVTARYEQMLGLAQMEGYEEILEIAQSAYDSATSEYDGIALLFS
ncbi:hypothetical protein HDV00_002975 [Rhizophlyctis rosea]|nr:hypothetical protein HDV00_002975 [Rhizophlyctis rosea]